MILKKEINSFADGDPELLAYFAETPSAVIPFLIEHTKEIVDVADEDPMTYYFSYLDPRALIGMAELIKYIDQRQDAFERHADLLETMDRAWKRYDKAHSDIPKSERMRAFREMEEDLETAETFNFENGTCDSSIAIEAHQLYKMFYLQMHPDQLPSISAAELNRVRDINLEEIRDIGGFDNTDERVWDVTTNFTISDLCETDVMVTALRERARADQKTGISKGFGGDGQSTVGSDDNNDDAPAQGGTGGKGPRPRQS